VIGIARSCGKCVGMVTFAISVDEAGGGDGGGGGDDENVADGDVEGGGTDFEA